MARLFHLQRRLACIRAPAAAMAAAVAAGMTRGEHRRRNISGAPRRDVGDDAAGIFVRPDIEDPDVAFAEQCAQRVRRGLGHLQFLRDRPPSIQARRCRANAPAWSDRDPAPDEPAPRTCRHRWSGSHRRGDARRDFRPASRSSRHRAPPGCRPNSATTAAPSPAPAASSPPPRQARTSTAAPPKTSGARDPGAAADMHLFSRMGAYSPTKG